jgi:phosphoserine phosphatase
MDDTLITNNKWLDVNLALGVTKCEDDALYNQFTEGDITYDQWTHLLQQLYHNHGPHNRLQIERELIKVEWAAGAAQAAKATRDYGMATAVITGSFCLTAAHVAHELNIDHWRANTSLHFTNTSNQTADNLNANELHTVSIVSGGEEGNAKVRLLQDLCHNLGYELTDCIAVGEGANDIPLFAATGFGITFSNAKPAVQAAAAVTINSLEELPTILGNLVNA